MRHTITKTEFQNDLSNVLCEKLEALFAQKTHIEIFTNIAFLVSRVRVYEECDIYNFADVYALDEKTNKYAFTRANYSETFYRYDCDADAHEHIAELARAKVSADL